MTQAAAIATIQAAHTAAEAGGVTPGTSATVAPIGNMTTWSRYSARAALAAGSITYSQFVSVMNFLGTYEQEQRNQAIDSNGLRGQAHGV
jgi:hypothetical protein